MESAWRFLGMCTTAAFFVSWLHGMLGTTGLLLGLLAAILAIARAK